MTNSQSVRLLGFHRQVRSLTASAWSSSSAPTVRRQVWENSYFRRCPPTLLNGSSIIFYRLVITCSMKRGQTEKGSLFPPIKERLQSAETSSSLARHRAVLCDGNLVSCQSGSRNHCHYLKRHSYFKAVENSAGHFASSRGATHSENARSVVCANHDQGTFTSGRIGWKPYLVCDVSISDLWRSAVARARTAFRRERGKYAIPYAIVFFDSANATDAERISSYDLD
jgi:hypothetical protein